MNSFKYFLLNEEQSFLGHEVGDVLTSVQDLNSDLGGMGTRQIAKVGEDIVNQIRKILHSQWSPKQKAYLKDLQKIAVALMKAIDEKDNLKEIVPQLSQELSKISTKLGVKVNNLKAIPEEGGDEIDPQNMQLTGTGPTQAPMPPTPGMPPEGQAPAPPMPGAMPGGQAPMPPTPGMPPMPGL